MKQPDRGKDNTGLTYHTITNPHIAALFSSPPALALFHTHISPVTAADQTAMLTYNLPRLSLRSQRFCRCSVSSCARVRSAWIIFCIASRSLTWSASTTCAAMRVAATA